MERPTLKFEGGSYLKGSNARIDCRYSDWRPVSPLELIVCSAGSSCGFELAARKVRASDSLAHPGFARVLGHL